jgi:hypothetical protein
MNSKNPLAASDAGSFPLRDKRRNEDKKPIMMIGAGKEVKPYLLR